MRQLRETYWIILFLIFLGLYRFLLIGNGAMSLHDEYRYYKTVMAVKSLVKGDIKAFCTYISNADGRPGDSTLRLLPAMLQQILFSWKGVFFENPTALLIPQSLNVIISLTLSFLFYKITLLLFQNNTKIALSGTVIYSLFVNSNIYIRHIFPYDSALLFFLLALYYSVKKSNLQIQKYIGLLAGFGFAIYPGYYFFPAIILSVLLLNNNTKLSFKPRLTGSIIFGASFAGVLLFYELISRAGGISYFFTARALSGTIVLGSFEDGFTFLPEYLILVENVAGLILILGVILYVLMAMLRSEPIENNNPRALKIICSTAAAGYLIHAVSSVIFHKMVFYGRLIHMYYPFMVWAMLSAVISIKYSFLRKSAYAAIVGSSLFSFALFSFEYFPLAYPADVLYKNKINTLSKNPPLFFNETITNLNYLSPPRFDSSPMNNKNIILVNLCMFYPVSPDFQTFTPPANSKILYEGRHFLSFPAYGFEEGYTIKERMLLKQRNYRVSLIETDKVNSTP